MEHYDEVLDVNLKGSFLACQVRDPGADRRGRRLDRQHRLGRGGPRLRHLPPRVLRLEGGQLGLTLDLAGAYGRDNVRVNAVLPGMVATPMLASVGTLTDDVRAKLNLLGRMGDAWDIAHAVLFLCSDEGSYITGVDAARRRRRHRRDARLRAARGAGSADAVLAPAR